MFKLVGTVFLGLFLILFVLFPLVGLIFQIKYFEVLKMIWDLFLIAFSTTSKPAVLQHWQSPEELQAILRVQLQCLYWSSQAQAS